MSEIDTKLFVIEDIDRDDAKMAEAAAMLRAGKVVAIPTETVYGLGASIDCEEAIKNVFLAKGRPQDNPLIVHVDRVEMAKELYAAFPPEAQALTDAFWPGPLTIILPKTERVSATVSGGLDTVAVRMPSDPIAHRLIELAGVPIAAPSANLSGYPSPTTARHVQRDLTGKIDGIVCGPDCQVGVESTVVSLAGPAPELLRPGAVTLEQLRGVLGRCEASPAILHMLREGEVAASPGMKYKHYSPKANVVILKGDFPAYCAYLKDHAGPGVYAMCFDGEEGALPVPAVPYGHRESDEEQARHLFAVLRDFDDLGAKTVYARSPKEEGVALAVYNRLLRAAAFEVIDLG